MSDAPTSSHIARYHPGNVKIAEDGRLYSPVFERNSPRLIAALAPWLGNAEGPVLEIGGGTGQHAAAFQLAFPGLDWVASDPDPGHRASTEAWRVRLGLPAEAALDLDAARDWAGESRIRALGPLAAVVAINVIHIAPFEVAEGILKGAGAALGSGGLMIFYGPFRVAGAHIGPGNAAFDAGLRNENPDWGVRDVEAIEALAAASGIEPAALEAMPANNRLVIFRRA